MPAFRKILDNGAEVAPFRGTLNLINATIADSAANDRTDITFQTGDITGVTAGAGLTGGGAAGAVTLDVGAGTGVTVNANDVALTVPVVIASGGTNSVAALNNSRVMVSSGGAIVEAGAMTNGQLVVGSTGAAPVVAALTAGAGISVTNAAGAITLATAASFIRQQTTVLTNAQILNLRATPITVVTAPGAGLWAEFVSAVLIFNRTAGYTETADNFVIRAVNGTGTSVSGAIETTGFVDAAGDAITSVAPVGTPPIITAAGELSNAALVIHNTGDGELGAGDAANTITVIVTYRIHTTTL